MELTLSTGKVVVVRELTVREAVKFVETYEDSTSVDVLMNKGIPERLIKLCTALSTEEIEELLPSDLNRIIEEVRKENSFLCELKDRLESKIMEIAMAQAEKEIEAALKLEEQPAISQEPADTAA